MIKKIKREKKRKKKARQVKERKDRLIISGGVCRDTHANDRVGAPK